MADEARVGAARRAVSAAFADEWARVVATLIRVTGDWALAEDAAQEAFATAARTWPVDGVPDRPGAWLTTVARRAALDRHRRRATELRAQRRAAVDPTTGAWASVDGAEGGVDGGSGSSGGAWDGRDGSRPDDSLPDDLLRLVFTCCHPALAPQARVALTLRTVTGLEVAEVAAAFSIREDAMAKRLVRARAKIAHARIPYRVPTGPELADRLDAVLTVVYLVFTEGYAPTAGEVVRADLSDRALHLAGALAALMPDRSEVHALHALLLLHDSRRAARVDAAGDPVPLDEQDRALWDARRIAAGLAALDSAVAALGAQQPGRYLLQASIAACHAAAPGTDWRRVVRLYDALLAVAPTPHAALARAVAVGRAEGPDAGLTALAAVAEVDPGLRAAAEADLHRRAGRLGPAAEAYRAALGLTSGATRRFVARRLAECDRS